MIAAIAMLRNNGSVSVVNEREDLTGICGHKIVALHLILIQYVLQIATEKRTDKEKRLTVRKQRDYSSQARYTDYTYYIHKIDRSYIERANCGPGNVIYLCYKV